MLTYLRRLTDERVNLSETMTRTADQAASEERDLTEAESTALAGLQSRCAEIDRQLEQYNAQAESMRAFAALQDKLVAMRPTPERAPVGAPESRLPAQLETSAWGMWGQRFVESEEFRSYPGRGQGRAVEVTGFLETRAPITTTTLASTIPHYLYAPVVYETKAPLLEVCNRVVVSSGTVDWVELGGDPQAAVVAEGAAKPEATLTATPKSAALDTLAHWVQITRQALADASYIRSIVEGKLRRGLLNKAEADMAAAIDAATTQTATDATNLSNAIRIGIGKVEASGYTPNAIVLNPADHAALDVAVASTYGSTGPDRRNTYWGLTPVSAAAIPAGKAYVGDFQSGATLFDRGVTDVFTTDSHSDFFVKNILVILAEARLKSAVTDPLALCECTKSP